MKIILCLMFGLITVHSSPTGSDKLVVEPEYLNELLREHKYEEFSALLGLPDPELVKEKVVDGRSELTHEEAMFHENLKFGDFLLPEEGLEDSRSSVSRSSALWTNRKVPYEIANDAGNNNFTNDQRNRIISGINRWNAQLRDCIELVPRNGEREYVFVFSGSGCWSYIGRTGRSPQGLSLQHNSCIYQGTVIHEFQHAIGFAHEHNRLDRDNKVEVLWNNIPQRWRSQYEKVNSNSYRDLVGYDYYSIMHYPYNAPGTRNPAFNIKENGIDTNRLGRGNDFTGTDLRKIRQLYNCRQQ